MREYLTGPTLDALAVIGRQTIYVTGPGYDDIGKLLSALGVEYKLFNGKYDCNLLFLNCGTADALDSAQLKSFVERAGCLYAPDLTSRIVPRAFLGCFHPSGGGVSGTVRALVVDQGIRETTGQSVDITIDLDNWSLLAASSEDTLCKLHPVHLMQGIPSWLSSTSGRELSSTIICKLQAKRTRCPSTWP